MEFTRVGGEMITGTSLRGYITTSYAKLVKTFGQPDLEHGEKSRAEWDLRFADGTIVTIYDWKMHYQPLQNVTQWNVGGVDVRAVALVQAALDVA